MEISFQHGDKTWTEMRERGLKELYYLAGVILKYGDVVGMTEGMHKVMCRVVEKKTGVPELDTCPQRLILMPRGSGKCLTADAEVLVEGRGYVRHDQLQVGDRIWAVGEDWVGGWRKIVAVEPQPAEPLVRVTLGTGRVLTGTPMHRVRGMKGWTYFDQLTPGKRVPISRWTPEGQRTLRPGESAFLGYMTGDGTCQRVRFTNNDPRILDDYEASVRLLGGEPWRRPQRSSATDIDARKMRPILRDHGIEFSNSWTKRIPQAIWEATNAEASAFLGALWSCDGSVSSNRAEYYSVSEGLARDVQRLLLRFGIVASLAPKRGRYQGKEHWSWRVSFGGKEQFEAFQAVRLVGRKADAVQSICQRPSGRGNGDTIPEEWRDSLPKHQRGEKHPNSLRLTHKIRVDNSGPTSTSKVQAAASALGLEELTQLATATWWDTVTEVEWVEPEVTYAIEVEGDHIYCAEDVVCHNSTIISQAYVVQRIIQDPNIAILICNEKLENAQSFLSAIKHVFEQNELFRALYPEVIHQDIKAANVKWNDTEINVPRTTGRKEFTIKCQGVGAALASMHPDIIIVDDMVSREAAENARRGDGQLTGAINRWVNQLVPLLNPGYQPFPEIIVLGTRWYRGDPYEHVETAFGYGMPRKTWNLGLKLPNGDVQSLPVHRAGDLVIFSRQVVENGRPAWPERPGYDLESLAKFRLRDPALYAANMMNDPSDEITATFKESWLQFYDWSGEQALTWVDQTAKTRNVFLADLDILVLVDPGGFGRVKGSDRSRGAILVTGSTGGENPEHLVLDCFSDKVPYTVVAEKILALATRYPPRRVFIEEVGQQAAFYDLVVLTAKKRGLQLAFDKLTPKNRDKDARILGLEPYFQRGMIRIGKGPQFHELREQYRAWPTPRADLLDVLAYGPEVWRQQRVSRQGVEARQRMEKDAVLTRMGVSLRR